MEIPDHERFCDFARDLSDEEFATLLCSPVFGPEWWDHTAFCGQCSPRSTDLMRRWDPDGPPVVSPYQRAIKEMEDAARRGATDLSGLAEAAFAKVRT